MFKLITFVFSFFIVFSSFATMSSLSTCQRELWNSLGLVPLERSVSGLGFVGARANYTDKDVERMQELGVTEWGQWFILVSSEEQIHALESAQRDLMFRPSYLLVNEDFLNKMRKVALDDYEMKKIKRALEDTIENTLDSTYLNKYRESLKAREEASLAILNELKSIEEQKESVIIERDALLLEGQEADLDLKKKVDFLESLEKKIQDLKTDLTNKGEFIEEIKERIDLAEKDLLENSMRFFLKDSVQDQVSMEDFFKELSTSGVELIWFVDGKRYSAPSSYLRDVLKLEISEIRHGEKFRSYYAPNLRDKMREFDLPYVSSGPRPGPGDAPTNEGDLMSTPMIRGGIEAKDLIIIPSSSFKLANSIKRLRSKWKSLAKEGYSIVFNKNHEKALFMLKNQARKNMDVLSNAFQDEAYANEFREKFKDGRAFTVEVLDPDGNLIGGNIGDIVNGLISAKSVFYDKNIDYAKYSVIALLSVAYQNNISFVDTLQVTPFTASVHGKYIPRKEFYELWKSFPKVNSLVFPQKWDIEE